MISVLINLFRILLGYYLCGWDYIPAGGMTGGRGIGFLDPPNIFRFGAAGLFNANLIWKKVYTHYTQISLITLQSCKIYDIMSKQISYELWFEMLAYIFSEASVKGHLRLPQNTPSAPSKPEHLYQSTASQVT